MVAVPVLVGSLGRIIVGALTDRFGGRVMFPIVSARDDRARPVPGLLRARLLLADAVRRVLPRHRRHRLRRRCPLRQRVVPAREARPRRRHLRRRHGWHRDQRPDHRPAVGGPRPHRALPDHRGGPRGLRRRRLAGDARRTRPRRTDDEPRHPPRRQRAPADHVAGLRALRGRLRRLRRVLGLPADLPEDRPRPRAGRRGQPDGRVRRGGGRDATGRRVAVGPARVDPRAVRVVRRRDGVRRDRRAEPAGDLGRRQQPHPRHRARSW